MDNIGSMVYHNNYSFVISYGEDTGLELPIDIREYTFIAEELEGYINQPNLRNIDSIIQRAETQSIYGLYLLKEITEQYLKTFIRLAKKHGVEEMIKTNEENNYTKTMNILGDILKLTPHSAFKMCVNNEHEKTTRNIDISNEDYKILEKVAEVEKEELADLILNTVILKILNIEEKKFTRNPKKIMPEYNPYEIQKWQSFWNYTKVHTRVL